MDSATKDVTAGTHNGWIIFKQKLNCDLFGKAAPAAMELFLNECEWIIFLISFLEQLKCDMDESRCWKNHPNRTSNTMLIASGIRIMPWTLSVHKIQKNSIKRFIFGKYSTILL